MPAPTVPSAQKVADKWVDGAKRGAEDLVVNATAHAQKWEGNAAAAVDNFKSAISSGDIGRRFTGGIHKAGAAKFTRGMQQKAASRFAGGVEAGKPEFQAAAQANLQVIAATDIGARKLRGDPANRRRSELIQEALHKARIARLGAGA